jgi:hypothetical protein
MNWQCAGNMAVTPQGFAQSFHVETAAARSGYRRSIPAGPFRVDLAVVHPATRSLVLRAGGTDTRHANTTLAEQERESRLASSASFDAATQRMIGNFDVALKQFEADVKAGKANVRVVQRNAIASTGGGHGGGGSFAAAWLLLLLPLALWRRASTWPVALLRSAPSAAPALRSR